VSIGISERSFAPTYIVFNIHQRRESEIEENNRNKMANLSSKDIFDQKNDSTASLMRMTCTHNTDREERESESEKEKEKGCSQEDRKCDIELHCVQSARSQFSIPSKSDRSG
jgi:hypothetical protein